MEIIAHRGIHKNKEEENTIGAFNRAVFVGCGMMELDCRLTKDKKLVINHDPYFKLHSGARVYIRQNTFEELCQKVGSVIPLEFVLRVFTGAIRINVELKDKNSAYVLNDILYKLKTENKWTHTFVSKNIIVSSFLLKEVAVFKIVYYWNIETAWLRKYRHLLLTSKRFLCRDLDEFGLDAIHLNHESVSKDLVGFFKDRDFSVRVYTVSDLDLLKKYKDWGVDGIFTDKAPEFLKILKELQKVKSSE